MITPFHQLVPFPSMPRRDARGAACNRRRIASHRSVHRSVRTIGRLVWLLGELVLTALLYVIHVLFSRSESLSSLRGRWLRHSCRRILRVFNISLSTAGPIPTRGLLVSNHLSYLDILVLGATTKAVFVAKREVRNWPLLGWFARRAGTVFVHREKRSDAARATAEIQAALESGTLVVVFPEGTSSGGDTVLPFKSALLEPATRQDLPLSGGCIRYSLSDGSVAEEVCYWRDMTLLPHLLNLLGKRRISAQVSFAQIQGHRGNRKTLARRLHAEVTRLKEGFPPPHSFPANNSIETSV